MSLLLRGCACLVLAVFAVACGTVSYPVKPYPLGKAFYDIKEEERYATYCLNVISLARDNQLELGYGGKLYARTEDMPLDRQPSMIRNGFWWPIALASYGTVLTAAGVSTYKALSHKEWGKEDPDGAKFWIGTLLGASFMAAIASWNLDTVANSGQYNVQIARDHGIAPERNPMAMCKALQDAGKMDVLMAHYRMNLAPKDAPKPADPSKPAVVIPGSLSPALPATPTSP